MIEAYEADGWLDAVLGLDRAAERAARLFAAHGEPDGGEAGDGEVLDALLGLWVLQERVRAAVSACEAAAAEPFAAPPAPPVPPRLLR